jgi:hypothetical protein
MYYVPYYGPSGVSWREVLPLLWRAPEVVLRVVMDQKRWDQDLIAAWAGGAGLWLGIGARLLVGGTSWPLVAGLVLGGTALWPAVLALLTLLYWGSAALLHGEGRWRPLYSGVAFGGLPAVLNLPLSVVLLPLGTLGTVLWVLGLGVLAIWTLRVWTKAVSESQGLIPEFALVALFLPATFTFLAIMAIFLTVTMGALLLGSFR